MRRYISLALVLTAGCSALRVASPLVPAGAGSAPAPPLEVAWRSDVGGAFGRVPVVATTDGMLVTTRRGEVVLIDADGRRRGAVSVGASVDGPAALVGGRTLVVGVEAGRYGVVALDLMNGGSRWRALRGVVVEAGVAVSGNTVVAPALDGVVYGVALGTGDVRWQTPAAPHATHRAPPVPIGDELVAVANTRGMVTAYRASDGTVVWTSDAGAPVEEAPALADGLLLVPTARGTLVALDAANGVERWTVDAGEAYDRFYTPSIADGTVYASSSNGVLLAMEAANGSEIWRYERDGHVASAPLVAGGRVYAGTLDERLIVLDARTGAERASYELTGRGKSSPIAVGPLVVLPAEPGLVWAFRAAAADGAGP